MDKIKVCLITLGCKVNKYESDCIAKMLENVGFETTEEFEFADYYIINTCAVTNEAEKKSRQYVSKINKINPNAKILVCGCASEADKEKFLNKNNVVKVFAYQRKDLILKYLLNEQYSEEELTCFNESLSNPKITQTRAYIKIQDGCNNFCSYCIIPYLRGRSVSRNIESILKEAEELSKYYKEIVLVGIDMSDYKKDGKLALELLMSRLKDIDARIRIGSLEVKVVTESFLKVLKQMPNFAPHFHLSLQSGDDFVLKKMNRKYTAKEYINACDLIYKYFPNANITTDIIVGFPFEEEENFENTISLAKAVGFGKIHCFPFSAKKGTVAYNYPDMTKEIKNKRMERLTSVANELQIAYNSKFIGKSLEVLVEEMEGDYFVGYSANYIKCYIPKKINCEIGSIKTFTAEKNYKEGVIVR